MPQLPTYIKTIMSILFPRGKDLIKTREQGQAQAPQRPWLNKSLVAVKEQGMLFHFNPSEMEVVVTYYHTQIPFSYEHIEHCPGGSESW